MPSLNKSIILSLILCITQCCKATTWSNWLDKMFAIESSCCNFINLTRLTSETLNKDNLQTILEKSLNSRKALFIIHNDILENIEQLNELNMIEQACAIYDRIGSSYWQNWQRPECLMKARNATYAGLPKTKSPESENLGVMPKPKTNTYFICRNHIEIAIHHICKNAPTMLSHSDKIDIEMQGLLFSLAEIYKEHMRDLVSDYNGFNQGKILNYREYFEFSSGVTRAIITMANTMHNTTASKTEVSANKSTNPLTSGHLK